MSTQAHWLLKSFHYCLLLIFISCKEHLSDDLKQKIFEESKFNNPITMDLPPESPQEKYQNILNNPVIEDNRAVLQVSSNEPSYRHNLFLKEIGFITVENLKQKTIGYWIGERENSFEFIFYTDKLRHYLETDNSRHKYGKLKIGQRILDKITSVKSEESVLYGTKISLQRIEFAYYIESLLKDFGYSTTEKFTGKVLLTKTPLDDTWNVQEIHLPDNDEYSILQQSRTP